jgi:hypothetical protein
MSCFFPKYFLQKMFVLSCIFRWGNTIFLSKPFGKIGLLGKSNRISDLRDIVSSCLVWYLNGIFLKLFFETINNSEWSQGSVISLSRKQCNASLAMAIVKRYLRSNAMWVMAGAIMVSLLPRPARDLE